MEIKTFISPLLDENCYAVIVEDEIAIIDPGTLTPELEKFAEKNKEKIKYILLTHRHFDHLMGVSKLKNICPESAICCHILEKDGTLSDEFSLAAAMGLSLDGGVEVDKVFENGDLFLLGGKTLKVLQTPGHTAGSVSFILDDVIFSGDTLFNLSIGRTDFESGSIFDMMSSLKVLNELDGDYNVYPGHGPATTLNFERQNNPYMNRVV